MANETLGDNADIVMGQSPPGSSVSASPNGLPLLNGPTEFGSHHPTPVQFTMDVRKRALPGDILFCVRGSTTGRMNWADQEYAIGRGIAAIRHRKISTLQPLVRAVIENGLEGLLAQATGSTFPNVSASQLSALPYPTLEEAEQLAIAHILGSLDDKIELNRRMNETLEAIARAIFKSWFVDFDPVRAKAEGSDPGLPNEIAVLFPDSFQDSELGEIPKGWEVKPIESICETVTRGVMPKYEEGTGRFIINQRVNRGTYLEWSALKELSSTLEVPTDRYAKRWDVLVNCLGEGTLGRTHLFRGASNIYAVDQHMSICRPITAAGGAFLYQVLSSPEGQNKIESLKTGSTGMTMFNISKLRAFELLWPGERLVNEYFKHVGQGWLRVAASDEESSVLAALRDTLLPKLLSGELRVPDAKKFFEEAGL